MANVSFGAGFDKRDLVGQPILHVLASTSSRTAAIDILNVARRLMQLQDLPLRGSRDIEGIRLRYTCQDTQGGHVSNLPPSQFPLNRYSAKIREQTDG